MERHIEAERIDLVINLFGNFDENVKIIETIANTKITDLIISKE